MLGALIGHNQTSLLTSAITEPNEGAPHVAKQIRLVSPKVFQFHGLNYTRDITKKYYLPPLAMLTVAGLIPRHHSLRLVDENVCALRDEDIEWADVILMTGLTPNEPFIKEAAERCRRAGKHIILGGCHATLYLDEIDYVDTVVVGEELKRVFNQ